MKKFLGLLVLILLLTDCDDGNLTVENISFGEVNASSCGEIVYKLKGSEALFLKIPATANAFKNEITPPDAPRIIPITANVIVRYRAYSGNVTSDNVCPDVIQPISPVVTVEWIATSGNIEITTTAIYSTPDAATGATTLLKYNHNIVFTNITFSKTSGEQRYDTFSFGDYATTATNLPLGFVSDNVRICTSNNTIYNAADGGIEALVIQNIDPALLATTNLNTPKTGLITATTNKLSYRLFTTALITGSNPDYFCQAVFPDMPAVNEEWLADEGVSSILGAIEITTTNTPAQNVYKHTIRLKGVTFRKGRSTFYYGNDILLGELIF
ncbi:MAG: hypothetical protein H7199_10200 [Burkholderiales bacterium]|nr:hypothetical protein [Flavobacterium sp.]